MAERRFDPRTLTLSDWINLGARWQVRFEELLVRWFTREGINRISIYGTGETARSLICFLEKANITVEGIYHAKETGTWMNRPILAPEELRNRENPVILVASSRPAVDLKDLVSRLSATGARVVLLEEALRDGTEPWLHWFDLIPEQCALRFPFYDEAPGHFWDVYGTRWASEAHPERGGSNREVQARILQTALIPLEPSSVLEVGCGTGRMLEPISQALGGTFIAGCDLSGKMLHRAKTVIPNVPLLMANMAEGLPFPDNSFDLVYAVAVIQHLPAPLHENALSEIRRVARKFILHWEYRWPPSAGAFVFDHDLAAWYRSRGDIVRDLDPGAADCFPDQPERTQFYRIELAC